MKVERHLILQEHILPPSAEWSPQCHGWLVARVADGTGYWLQSGTTARQLTVGDGLISAHNNISGVIRASQLGPLKLQFFTIHPQHLNGVLTVAEWHQFEVVPNNPSAQVSIFSASEPTGQKFSRLADQSRGEGLSMRCALLQLWAGAVAGFLSAPAAAPAGDNKLRERFRQMVGQISEAELAECSLDELAKQLHCSERHFSRLFREEFGVPLRARQIELRLQRARQLLTDSDAKIINVAYESGYRHLGLFNAMFKKRFGMTPGEWRQQSARKNPPAQPRNQFSKITTRVGILLAVLTLNFILPAFAQTSPAASDSRPVAQARAALLQKMAELDAEENKPKFHVVPVSTNAGPGFKVEKYLVSGNSILPPGNVGGIFTNVPQAFGTNVTFDAIRAAVGDLQLAYRERGFVTVSVALPQQKLTNATVKVQVIEGRLAAINVEGNRWFSSNNVMRALPSLHTNILLNSHVFQRELDNANASRDRQIYPVIGPGPEPRTSELTLKVKDVLPLHARSEINNESTPGTPDLRVNFNSQYDNLWDLEHQVGLQYGFTPEKLKSDDLYSATPFDSPLIANYSTYYRLPLGGYSSVQQQVDGNPSSFGYNEVTHQFNLPPATGRPELTFYASRSVSDTAPQNPFPHVLISTNGFIITTNTSGEVVTVNQDLGARLSMPLPAAVGISGTLSLGVDLKDYQSTSFQTNNSFFKIQIGTDPQTGQPIYQTSTVPQAQPTAYNRVDYLPFNLSLNGSVPDKFGTTFFNANANFNLLPVFSVEPGSINVTNITPTGTNVTAKTRSVHGHTFSSAAYTAKARPDYLTLQFGVNRVQKIYRDWTVKLHADGQWASGALLSNEQFGMGGTAGVRGYSDGEAYGDEGWRVMVEPQTPSFNIGMMGNEGHEAQCWVRGSAFMDYGETYLLEPSAGSRRRQQFWGAGLGGTLSIGAHFDARLQVACPLLSTKLTSAGNIHVYFGIGAQF